MIPGEPLALSEALRLARSIALTHGIDHTSHCRDRMASREIDALDIANAIRGGQCTLYDFERGTYRYRIEARNHGVVASFDDLETVVAITCWET